MMDLSEAVNYWIEWHGKATAEWPWRFHVLNVEQSAKTVCPGTNPERFAELLIAVSNTVEEAAANDSTDYVAFAKPPNGWKRGEKLAMRRLCAAVAKPDCSLSELGIALDKVSDPHPWPKPGRGGHGNPWEPTVFKSADERPLLTLVELIDRFRNGGALDVPFDEWRHIDGDFRPLAIFKLIVGSHILPHRVNGELMNYPDGDEVKFTNCVALHTPRGSRDTARKSARTWQARNLLGLLNSVYSRHFEVVHRAWPTPGDPVFQLICNPTPATVRAARLFLWREINQQNSRLADKAGEVKPPAALKGEGMPGDENTFPRPSVPEPPESLVQEAMKAFPAAILAAKTDGQHVHRAPSFPGTAMSFVGTNVLPADGERYATFIRMADLLVQRGHLQETAIWAISRLIEARRLRFPPDARIEGQPCLGTTPALWDWWKAGCQRETPPGSHSTPLPGEPPKPLADPKVEETPVDESEVLVPSRGVPLQDTSTVWPPDDGWYFDDGEAAYLSHRFPIRGPLLKLLKAFVHSAMSNHRSIAKATLLNVIQNGGANPGEDTLRGYVSLLRTLLRDEFKIDHKSHRHNPIRSVNRGNALAYKLEVSTIALKGAMARNKAHRKSSAK